MKLTEMASTVNIAEFIGSLVQGSGIGLSHPKVYITVTQPHSTSPQHFYCLLLEGLVSITECKVCL